MKRFGVILLTLLLVLSILAGCGAAPKKASRGSITNDAYTNEFVGFTFTKPADWTYSTEEELAELMQTTADVLGNETLAESMLNELQVIFAMMAKDVTGANNVSIYYENLSVTGNANLDIKTYIQASKETIKQTILSSATFSDATEVQFAGQTYWTYDIELPGVNAVQRQYIRKIGNLMVLVGVTAQDEAGLDTIASYFTAIK